LKHVKRGYHEPSGVVVSISEQLLYINVQRFRGGLVLKAHRLLYHLTLASNKEEEEVRRAGGTSPGGARRTSARRERKLASADMLSENLRSRPF